MERVVDDDRTAREWEKHLAHAFSPNPVTVIEGLEVPLIQRNPEPRTQNPVIKEWKPP
jgi:hypothetical protein